MKIAIFDFDNTLAEGYSRYQLAYLLEEHGLTPKGLKNEVETLQQAYEDGSISYNDKFDQDKKIFSKYYKGISKSEVEKFMYEHLNLEEKIFPWSKPLIEKLQSEGYMTVVLSGCWDFIIEYAHEILQFDTFFATTFGVSEGCFTGEFTSIIDYKKKLHYTNQLLLNSEKSIGIGDSEADLVYLEKVDHGFLYEPPKDVVNKGFDTKIQMVNSSDVLEKVLAIA